MQENEVSAGPDILGAEGGGARHPLLSVPGFTRLMLASVSSYILVVSLFVYWTSFRELRFFNLYYLAMMALSASLALFSLREVTVRHNNLFEKRNWPRVLVVFGFGAVAWAMYRYPELFSFSVWIDEMMQFQGFWEYPRRILFDPALFAASQQQPPMDYYLSAFARNTLGMTETAVLMHAISFGILSFFAFLLWLIQIRFPLVLVPIPILLFASHHSLLQFSSQARPISMAVFFALTTLIFAYESVQKKKACIFPMGASALLLLYSVGLQPMFFLAVLSISLLPLLLRHFERAEAIKFLLALSVIPLIIFSPTVWEIYRESERHNQFYSASFFELWWNTLNAMKWGDFEGYFTTLKYALWILFIPPAVFIFSLSLRMFGYKRFSPAIGSLALAGTIFSVLFPLAFQVFWSIINWHNNLYYFVLWPVGCFALVSLCLARFLQPLFEEKGKEWAASALGLICVFGVCALHLGYAQFHRDRVRGDFSHRPDWHAIVKESRRSSRPVVVVEIPYAKFGEVVEHSIAGAFYEGATSFRLARLRAHDEVVAKNMTARLYETMKDFESRSDVLYLIRLNSFTLEKELKQKVLSALRKDTDEMVQLNERFFLFRADDQESPIRKTRSIFEKIVEADPANKRNFYLVDALMNEAIRTKDCKGAQKWLALLGAIRNETAPNYHDGLGKYLVKARGRTNEIPSCENIKARPIHHAQGGR